MKTCPQCLGEYNDDLVFCLIDGNQLVAADGEVETVVVPAFAPQMPASPQEICGACGNINRSSSKFCKKCGAPVASVRPASPVPFEPTVAIPSGLFTPPKAAIVTSAPAARNKAVLYGAAGFAAVVIIGLLFIYSGGRTSDNPRNSAQKNAANSAHPDVGRTGRLTTNQKIRSAPNLDSEVLGVHYQNARIHILAVSTYTTSEGLMKWYRVRVTENGCDAEGILGCGNDLNGVYGAAATEGWTSARNVSLE